MLKKGILALAAFVMLAFTAQAQDGPQKGRKGPNPEKRAERMDKLVADLGLDEATAASFKEIHADLEEKAKEIRNLDIDRKEKRAQLDALRTAADEQVKEILTEEQFAQYEKTKKKHQKRQKRRRKGKSDEGRQ
jgi:Spy/CpxP family protein refolding chaperone